MSKDLSQTKFSDFWWAENHLCPEHNGFESIIKISPPQAFIKYKVADAFVSFESFYTSVAEVNWFGVKPPEEEQRQILFDAWNYLALEERILENDIDTIPDEEY